MINIPRFLQFQFQPVISFLVWASLKIKLYFQFHVLAVAFGSFGILADGLSSSDSRESSVLLVWYAWWHFWCVGWIQWCKLIFNCFTSFVKCFCVLFPSRSCYPLFPLRHIMNRFHMTQFPISFGVYFYLFLFVCRGYVLQYLPLISAAILAIISLADLIIPAAFV